MNKQDMDYMGDGVYVGHDGYRQLEPPVRVGSKR